MKLTIFMESLKDESAARLLKLQIIENIDLMCIILLTMSAVIETWFHQKNGIGARF